MSQADTAPPQSPDPAPPHGHRLMFGAAPARDIVPSVRGLYWRAMSWAAVQANAHLARPATTSGSHFVHTNSEALAERYTRMMGTLGLALKRISSEEVAVCAADLLAPSHLSEIDAAVLRVSAWEHPRPPDLSKKQKKKQEAAARAAASEAPPDEATAASSVPPMPPPGAAHMSGMADLDDSGLDGDSDSAEYDRNKDAENLYFIHTTLRGLSPEDPSRWPVATRRYFGVVLPGDEHLALERPGALAKLVAMSLQRDGLEFIRDLNDRMDAIRAEEMDDGEDDAEDLEACDIEGEGKPGEATDAEYLPEIEVRMPSAAPAVTASATPPLVASKHAIPEKTAKTEVRMPFRAASAGPTPFEGWRGPLVPLHVLGRAQQDP